MLAVVFFGSLAVAAVLTPPLYWAVQWWDGRAPSETTKWLLGKGIDVYFDRLRWVPILAGLPWLMTACHLWSRQAMGLKFDQRGWLGYGGGVHGRAGVGVGAGDGADGVHGGVAAGECGVGERAGAGVAGGGDSGVFRGDDFPGVDVADILHGDAAAMAGAGGDVGVFRVHAFQGAGEHLAGTCRRECIGTRGGWWRFGRRAGL